MPMRAWTPARMRTSQSHWRALTDGVCGKRLGAALLGGDARLCQTLAIAAGCTRFTVRAAQHMTQARTFTSAVAAGVTKGTAASAASRGSGRGSGGGHGSSSNAKQSGDNRGSRSATHKRDGKRSRPALATPDFELHEYVLQPGNASGTGTAAGSEAGSNSPQKNGRPANSRYARTLEDYRSTPEFRMHCRKAGLVGGPASGRTRLEAKLKRLVDDGLLDAGLVAAERSRDPAALVDQPVKCVCLNCGHVQELPAECWRGAPGERWFLQRDHRCIARSPTHKTKSIDASGRVTTGIDALVEDDSRVENRDPGSAGRAAIPPPSTEHGTAAPRWRRFAMVPLARVPYAQRPARKTLYGLVNSTGAMAGGSSEDSAVVVGASASSESGDRYSRRDVE